MAISGNIDTYSDALVILGTAGIVVPLVRRWGLSPVLGYLCAGAVLGPLGLGSFIDQAPFLYWVTVVDAKNVAGIAELGVVFVFFLIGVELSYGRLVTMRRLVFGLGSLQVGVSGTAIGGVALLMGYSPAAAIILGSCLALSSTAIVIELLSIQKRLSSTTGRTSFSILLAQDIAVVPILFFISMMGAGGSGSISQHLLQTMAQAMLAVVIIVVVGRFLLRPLFRLVASSNTSELFVAATLFVIVGAGLAASISGLTMALGAFIAGLLLAETEYRRAIQTTIEPFKSLLLGIFFFTVGMSIDFRELAREPAWLLASIFGLIALKAAIVVGLARLFQIPWLPAIETGLLLGPGGEFAFVGIGLAAALGVLDSTTASFGLAVTSVTMAALPLLSSMGRRLRTKFRPARPIDPDLIIAPRRVEGHAIVVGFGRVGQVVSDMLERHHFPFIAIDDDPAAIQSHRRRGREVYYGDATDPAFLKSCGIMRAAAVIVTIRSQATIDEAIKAIRSLRTDLPIVSRARDATHARHLYAIGVNDAVPETIEASLQLSEAALVGLGLPTGKVIASIHEKRDEFRSELLDAANQAGVQVTHGIKTKTQLGRGPATVPLTVADIEPRQ